MKEKKKLDKNGKILVVCKDSHTNEEYLLDIVPFLNNIELGIPFKQ